ncbi:DUF3068 domain-containing protein [Yinghuangia seranimata]|uniref:DUF3068 domain-containing protein n=1 Tax=Yinghuangia seranimata TaxID=408067 RepID=UPI00248B602F|nr:DUF3068 domain-containing protein [Yinghuangia seranimata]MDI2126262.1 DUF3068 domain-containing protein [Yinghuangia seranimata]
MRRRSSLVLLTLAVFCVALAPLLREYAFPRLVAKALNSDQAYKVMVLEADNATLFGAPEGDGKAKAYIIQTVKPNPDEATGQSVVWDMNLAMVDSTGKVVTQIPERYVFDAVSQAPKNCCGEQIDGKPVAHTGIQYKWPFFVQKRGYNYYDAQAHTAATIDYKGTENFNGLEVYRFEQSVPWTKVPVPSQLPGGLTPESVEQAGMERWYTTVRTFWVEPVTGAPVYAEEKHREEMRTPNPDDPAHPGVLVVFDGHVKMLPAWSNALIADAKDQRAQMLLIHDQLPLGLVVVGVVLFLVALLLEFLGRRKKADPATGGGTRGDDASPSGPGGSGNEGTAGREPVAVGASGGGAGANAAETAVLPRVADSPPLSGVTSESAAVAADAPAPASNGKTPATAFPDRPTSPPPAS